MKLYAVYGASGFGREVMPLVRDQFCATENDKSEIVFIDDRPPASEVNGHKVFTYNEFIRLDSSEKNVCIAIANSSIRETLARRCKADGLKPFSVHARNTIVMDSVEIGDGAILCPFVTITSGIRIGSFFHANIYSYVAHDCTIGDFVTFAPGVMCNGNVKVEDHAYIGTGAILHHGNPGEPLVIGRGAIVAMGAVVRKDVSPGAMVAGNPARIFNQA